MRAAIVLAVVAGVYVLVHFLFRYVAPFVFAFILSMMFAPVVRFTHRKLKIPKSVGTAAVIAFFLALFGFLTYLAVHRIQYEIRAFLDNDEQYIAWIRDFSGGLIRKYNELIGMAPVELVSYIENAAGGLITGLAGFFSDGLKQGVARAVPFLGGALLTFIVFVLSTFFMTKDREKLGEAMRSVLPEWLIRGYEAVKNGLIAAVVGYIKAQLTIMSVITTLCVAGYFIIGFPYALIFGLVTGIIDALPVFGAGAVLWPLAALCLLLGDYGMALALMCVYLVVFLTRQALEPKVLGGNIGVHPLLMLLSIYCGIKLYGVLGFFIGPMVVVMLKLAFSPKPGPAEPSAPEPAEPSSDESDPPGGVPSDLSAE
jgi:sporulation integral membrane protein YtvI